MKKFVLFLVLLVCVSGVNATLLNDDQGYWKFDEGTGTTASDDIGSQDFILDDGNDWGPGKINDGYNPGAAGTATVSSPTASFNDEMSLSVWLNYTGGAVGLEGRAIFFTSDRTYLHIRDGNYEVRIADGSDDNTGVANTPDVFEHVVLVVSGGDYQFWLNGVNEVNGTYSGSLDEWTAMRLSGTGSSNEWPGGIDELSYWNRTLTTAEIASLYNSGAGNQYPYTGGGGGNVTTVTLELDDLVTGSNINSASFANVSGSLTFDFFNITDSGFCVTMTGNGTSLNCTTGSGLNTYFNVSVSQNILVDTTVEAEAFQAFLNVSALQRYTDASILGFNVTNNQADNQTSVGSLLIPASNASNTVRVDVAGNFSQNFTFTISQPFTTGVENASGFFDLQYWINASDAVDGSAITSFSVNASNSTVGSVVNSTSGGLVLLPLLQNHYWNFLIDASGYAFSNVTRPGNSSNETYEFSLLPSNSILLFFYDEETLASILENVTVSYTNGSVVFEQSNSSGEMFLDDLMAGVWTLEVSADNYESRQYFVTIADRTSQDIDVYLLNSTIASLTTFTVKDADTADIVSGATFTMQHRVGANWVTFDQKITDAFGVAAFDLVDGKEYRFTIEADTYSTKVGTFTRTDSSYIVVLGSANTQSFLTYLDDFTYNVAPDDVSPNVTTFELITSSPDGRLDWFSVSVFLNGSTTTSNVTGSPSGGTASVLLNLSGFSGQTVIATYRVKSQNFADQLVVSRSWYIYELDTGNYTFTGFMEYYADDDNGLGFGSRGILLTIAAVFLAVVIGMFFGMEGAAVGASMVLMMGSYYGWLHWSVTIVVVTLTIGMFTVRGGGVR